MNRLFRSIMTLFRDPADHALAGNGRIATAEHEGFPRARILCIDDNVDFLRGLKRQLEREHTVITAPGPQEGLAALSEQAPIDVIICDLRMPGVKGVNFLNELRDAAPESERIILTGWADPLTLATASGDGRAMRLLVKPCPPAMLKDALADALLRSRARRLARATASA